MGLFLAPAEGFELQPRHFFPVVTEMEVTVIVIARKSSEQPGRGKTPRNTVLLSLGVAVGLFDYQSYSGKKTHVPIIQGYILRDRHYSSLLKLTIFEVPVFLMLS